MAAVRSAQPRPGGAGADEPASPRTEPTQHDADAHVPRARYQLAVASSKTSSSRLARLVACSTAVNRSFPAAVTGGRRDQAASPAGNYALTSQLWSPDVPEQR
jgi:hypothetical protein